MQKLCWLIAAVVAISLAQTPPPSAVTNLRNEVERNAALQKSAISLIGGQQVQFGPGFNTSVSDNRLQTVNLDTAYMSYRVPPPNGPGPAVDPVSGMAYGTGAWAVDRGYLYVVVPSGNPPLAQHIIDGQSVAMTFDAPNSSPNQFIWARTPLTTDWAK